MPSPLCSTCSRRAKMPTIRAKSLFSVTTRLHRNGSLSFLVDAPSQVSHTDLLSSAIIFLNHMVPRTLKSAFLFFQTNHLASIRQELKLSRGEGVTAVRFGCCRCCYYPVSMTCFASHNLAISLFSSLVVGDYCPNQNAPVSKPWKRKNDKGLTRNRQRLMSTWPQFNKLKETH